jgi:hypothetical protein
MSLTELTFVASMLFFNASVKKVMDHGYVSVKDIVSHLLAFSSKYRYIVTSDLEE